MKFFTKRLYKTIGVAIVLVTPMLYPHKKNFEKSGNIPNKQYNLFTYQAPDTNSYPAELTMMIIDLKYDDRLPLSEQIKICELGDGFTSRYKGFDAIYGIGEIWSRFWSFLRQFGLPVWFIDLGSSSRFDSFSAIDDFYNIPGSFIHNLSSLEASQVFRKQKAKNRGFNYNKLSSYANFVIKKYGPSTSTDTTAFRIKNPNTLVLSEATRHFTNNKYRTTQLFQDPSLKLLRPTFGVYKKQYRSNLAERIIKELKCEIFVIKPINAALGNGIIIVHKDNLDDTLNKILNHATSLGKDAKDPAYTYWRRDHNRIFIVEEYASSKPILVNREPYDATMRIVLSVWNNDNHINLTFLGAYWKLPIYPLNQPGVSLTDAHKSQVKHGRTSSATVSQEDFSNVIALLCKPLTKIYIQMLKERSARRHYIKSEGSILKNQPALNADYYLDSDATDLFRKACLEYELEG